VAVVVAALSGCVVFCALLPWGDPCTVQGYSGQPCPIVLSLPQENLRNGVFIILCLLIGFGAGVTTPRRRFLAGSLSVPLAAVLAAIGVRVIYPVHTSYFNVASARDAVAGFLWLLVLALLGTLGALLSQWCFPKAPLES